MGSQDVRDKTQTLQTRNRITGAVMAAIGLFVMIEAWGYGLGSVSRLGPGALPFGLGILIIVFGALIAIVNDDGHEAASKIVWRPLVAVLSALLAFALLIETAGLLVATAGLVFISGAADPDHSWRSLAAIYLILVVAVYVVFVRFLSIPFKLVTVAI